MPMLSGHAFRAQLVTQGKRELFDYWLRSAGNRRMPARSDLNPLEVPKLLPSIGLIDVREGLDAAAFRLAGTRLHEIYGQEITGKRTVDVFSGEKSDYWHRVHGRLLESCLPAHGVVRGPAEGRDHVVLFWLRLPLSENGGQVDRILCYDIAAPSSSPRAQPDRALFCYARVHAPPKPLARRVQCG
jgi:hypothetical protein